MQLTFSTLELSQRVRKESTLRKVELMIDWEALRPQLTGLYKREETRGGGQEPYDCVQMFKAILLGQWHSLSDAKLEEALLVRLDFLQFCGFGLMDALPDETTLCRFRNRLVAKNRLVYLLERINAQLQAHGLMVKHATGAVVDATLITSAARPDKTMTVAIDTGSGKEIEFEDGSRPGASCEEKQSADPDATWLKKGKKSHFGYRSYVVVDEGDGYVRGVHTAPANESEMTHFTKAIEGAHIRPNRVYADKGSSSKANREWLRNRKIKSAIMHKAVKNKPLTARQKLANRLISKKRYIVEQCFGTGKRLFGMARASYMTVAKVNAQITLKCICINLTKMANKIFDVQERKESIRLLNG
jgi:transposase, IS5 family